MIAAIRFAILALLVVALDQLLARLAGTGPAGLRLISGTMSVALPLLFAATVLSRWRFSFAAIVGILYGLEAVDVAVVGVVEAGWGWLSFVNVALWTLFRGSVVIWPLCVPLVVFLRRNRPVAAL